MKISVFVSSFLVVWASHNARSATVEEGAAGSSLHFGYHTENGQIRSEDIKFNMTANTAEKKKSLAEPVEYRGDYRFTSADGYEYTVKYRANKNGFQPFVTARKITKQ